MKFEIKKSIKPVLYEDAMIFLEKRVNDLSNNLNSELIWSLEHSLIYTAGISYKEKEIIDKNIKIIKSNRGGKITCHNLGQLIFYFVIDLKKRNKDIRKFINIIEKTIIETLREYKIESFADRKNIGIWIKRKNKIEKISAIGIKVKKWIAYHGFSININNNLEDYKKIIPCGIKNKNVTNLINIKNQNYSKLKDKIIYNFTKNLS